MKYLNFNIFLLLLATVLILSSCEDDDSLESSTLPPLIALIEPTLSDAVEEGADYTASVGLFSGRLAEQDITVDFATTGADVRSGSVVIAAGTSEAEIVLSFADNTVVDGAREVTLTITSSNAEFPVTSEKYGGDSFTFSVIDDLQQYSLGTGTEADTVTVMENDESFVVMLESLTASSDEDIEFTYEVDAMSSAVEGADYEIDGGTTFSVFEDSIQVPQFSIDLLDNEVIDADRFLKLNLTGLTASDESSIIDTLANSVIYKIVDNLSEITISSLAGAAISDGDTLVVSEAGTVEGVFSSDTESPDFVFARLLFNGSGMAPSGVSYIGSETATIAEDQQDGSVFVNFSESAFPIGDGDENTDDDLYLVMTISLDDTSGNDEISADDIEFVVVLESSTP
ncbi:MAG: hypothetical protein AAF731_07975 [Bacteroidota bacterium]